RGRRGGCGGEAESCAYREDVDRLIPDNEGSRVRGAARNKDAGYPPARGRRIAGSGSREPVEADHAARASRALRLRGGRPATASAIARMWSGVVPQQPPTRFSSPDWANSRSTPAISSGVSS